jgi:1,4-dihydroxy-2-naphthoate octaprenyltransferase
VFYQQGRVNVSIALLTVLCAFCIQILTNLVNDRSDADRGVDDESRLGPQRAFQRGVISRRQLNTLITLFVGLSVASGLLLVLHGGSSILAIGLVSLLFAFIYTSGPFPLAYIGLGEVFAFLFFGIIAAIGTEILLIQSWSKYSILLGSQIGCFAVLLISINNIRDLSQDQQRGKNTLAVRMGEQPYEKLIYAFLFLPFMMGVCWLLYDGAWSLFVFPLLALPLAFRFRQLLSQQLRNGGELNSLLARAAGLQLVFCALLLSAMIVPRIVP